MIKERAFWITRTAFFIALLVALQAATGALGSTMPQLVTALLGGSMAQLVLMPLKKRSREGVS